MRRRWMGMPIAVLALTACVTINVYFPAAEAREAAKEFVDKVIGETPDVFRLGELAPEKGAQVVTALNNTVKDFGFDESASWPSMQVALTKLNLTWNNDAATLAEPSCA